MRAQSEFGELLAEVGEFLGRVGRRAVGELGEALVVGLARRNVGLDHHLVLLAPERVEVVEHRAGGERRRRAGDEQHARAASEDGHAGNRGGEGHAADSDVARRERRISGAVYLTARRSATGTLGRRATAH